jgi:molecular chaperone DnaK (HSP70)
MSSPVLGIDLGTTNSVVAYADANRVRVLRDEDGRLLTPSTVSFLPSGDTVVGHAARDQRLIDAQNTIFSVKRLIGRPFNSPEVRRAAERLPFKLEEGPSGGVVVQMRGETYSLPELSSYILRRLRAIAERSLGQICSNAVITVPANFNELQRMATRDAGRIAGLNVLRVLNEPTAAALAYGYRAQQQQRIAVYDFGGGTFDISILELAGDVIEVIATAGDTHLGGDDLDRALADRMASEFHSRHGIKLQAQTQPYERLVMAAEWLKCQLSELDVAEATVKELVVEGGHALDLKFKLSREELCALCEPLIARTFTICEDALRLAAVRPAQLDGVILVGGQTRTPRVRQMVAEFFAMQPQYSVDPDLAVAHGAALQGYALSGLASAGSGRRIRTLAGPGTAAPAAPEDDWENAPTRVGATAELAQEPDPGNPFDDMPTRAGPRFISSPRPPRPSLRPEGMIGTHHSTLNGVGSGALDLPPSAAGEEVTVSNEGSSIQTDLLRLSAREALSPLRTLAETPAAKSGQRRSRAPIARASVASKPSPLPEADLPAVLRTPLPAAGPANDGESASTTLLETPKAKAGTRSSKRPAPADAEPSRTRLTAQKLADEGQREAALAIYGELLIKSPNDPQLLAEARAVRETGLALARPGAGLRPTASVMQPTAATSQPAATLAQPTASSRQAAAIVQPTASGEGPTAFSRSSASPLQPSAAGVSAPPTVAQSSVWAAPTATVPPTDTILQPSATTRSEPARPRGMPPPPPPRRSSGVAVPTSQRPSAAASELRQRAAPSLAATAYIPTPIPSGDPVEASSQFPAPPSIAPLLLDVTPHSLSVETVSGFCEPIIERNAPIPTEQTRLFTTSSDNQDMVSVRVSQGESRRIDDNQVLGQIELLQLRAARRGEVNIAVTFVIDADGTLSVRAVDASTGQGQEIRVNLVGAIEPEEIERMRRRAG